MTFPTLLALLQLAVPIQAPVAPPAKPAPPSIEMVIASALRSHPEILVAEAKLAGARADLELAKLTLSQKIVRAKGRLEAAQQTAAAAAEILKTHEALGQNRAISPTDLVEPRAKSLLAKEQLAEAEAVWKMYAPDPKPDQIIDVKWTYTPPMREAPVTQADRERFDILSRSVKIKKAEKVDLVEATKLLQSLPELKGLTLRVPNTSPVLSWEARELTVAGWLQFFADEYNAEFRLTVGIAPADRTAQWDWFVREYGLFFEKVANKPIGAPTLAEFLKTVRGAPTPKK